MSQADIEDLLKRTIGLDPTSVGRGAIDRAVKSRMMSLGLARAESYWDRLQNSSEELQQLIESVVVPETWFFRDRDAYAALIRLISEEWLPSHPASPLRILSVPCCTGEEPYSLVMALLDAGLPGEQIKVDAVDISAQAIARAKRGVYGSNSFRGEDLSYRDRYFESSRDGHSLPKWLRDLVAFHHKNMLSAEFRAGASPYDVIFCRNVLIYFDLHRQRHVLETLNGLLAPTGYLFVGPAEAFLAASCGFQSVNPSMSFAFRKERGDPTQTAKLPRLQLKQAPPISHRKPVEMVPRKIAPTQAVPAAAASRTLNWEEVRGLADVGRLTEASSQCEDYLKQQGPSSEAYYLLGLIRDASGDRKQASECYRKALYLEPDHPEALMHLALLCEREGDAAAALRLRDRARRAELNLKR